MRNYESLIPTDPLIYKGSSRAELGYGEQVASTKLFSSTNGKGRIGVYAAQPIAHGEVGASTTPDTTIIIPAPHEYRLEPLWMRRIQQLAVTYDARAVGVETPGTVGLMYPGENGRATVYDHTAKLEGATQTGSQLLGALRGDFREHADAQLDAIDETIGLGKGLNYVIFGESMGAAVATDMLGSMAMRGLNVRETVLYEQVNSFHGTKPLWPLKMMSLLPGVENDRRNTYIAENTEIGHPITAFELSGDTVDERGYRSRLDRMRKSLAQQGFAGIVNGLGMAHGRVRALERSLSFYESKSAPLITMVRGRDSSVTHASDFDGFANHFRGQGHDVRTFTVTDGGGSDEVTPIGHSHLFSIGRHADVVKRLCR